MAHMAQNDPGSGTRPLLIAWDIENCRLPVNAEPHEVVEAINDYNREKENLEQMYRTRAKGDFLAALTESNNPWRNNMVKALKAAGVNVVGVLGKPGGKGHEADDFLKTVGS